MKAYEYLPRGWSGVCGLGHVIPTMRVLTVPPEVCIVEGDLHTHTQTPWMRLLVLSFQVMEFEVYLFAKGTVHINEHINI